MPPQEVKSTMMSPGEATDFLYIATAIQSACFYPLTRYGMGVRALSWLGPAAFLWMLAVAEACHCALLYAWLCLWFIACIAQMFLRDRRQHSKYSGYPIVCNFPFVNTEMKGRVLEAVLIGAAGFALAPVDEHISGFFIGGWICLLVREAIERAVQQKRLRDMRDAAISNSMAADQYRQGW